LGNELIPKQYRQQHLYSQLHRTPALGQKHIAHLVKVHAI